jgi:hypothetical protein
VEKEEEKNGGNEKGSQDDKITRFPVLNSK